MSIIKLNKIVFSKDRNKQGFQYEIGTEEILFNTNEMIKASVNNDGRTHIQYKEALVNGFQCLESLDDIIKLIEENK